MSVVPIIKSIAKRVAPAALGFAATTIVNRGVRFIQEADPHFARTKGGTAIIRTITLNDGTAVRVLQQGGVFESATYLDEQRYTPVFAYQRAFNRVFQASLPLDDILMLGGGGYAWPKQVIATRPNIQLDVVEIDPAITALARRWFFLDQLYQDFPAAKTHLNIIHDDGRVFLEESHRLYSAIVNDTFSGKSPVMNLATTEALHLIKEHLVEGGIYATNVVSEDEGQNISFLRDVVTTARGVFDHVWIIPCEDELFGLEDNYLVVASDDSHPFSDTLPFDGDFLTAPLHDNALGLESAFNKTEA